MPKKVLAELRDDTRVEVNLPINEKTLSEIGVSLKDG